MRAIQLALLAVDRSIRWRMWCKRWQTAARCVALFAAGVVIWCGGASATPSCQGTYAATPLQPLPDRIVVDLDIRDRSQRNRMLADRFLRGVREAGVMVGQDANVMLHVSTSRLGETSSGAGRGVERSYPELGGLAGGGMRPTLPPVPVTGTTASRFAPAAQPLLAVRVDATEGKNTRIVWIATVQCRMTGTDEGRLAQELGSVIGSVLGKRIERQAF
jgi:hypothetical protein